MTDQATQAAIELLEESGEYKLLKRFYPVEAYHELQPKNIKIGCCADCESTGLDFDHHKPFEIGAVFFEYDVNTGLVGKILHTISQLEDPKQPISPLVASLTGVDDGMVKDAAFDDKEINQWIEKSSIIIAHNAKFDAGMLTPRFPILATKPWACTINDVDWEGEGVHQKSLGMLALLFSMFFDGHRALNDSEFLLHLLTLPLPTTRTPVLKAVLDSARTPTERIWAYGASYDARIVLKDHGFKWFPGSNKKNKGWFFDAKVSEKEDVLAHLSVNLPQESLQPHFEKMTAFNRYTA